MPMIPEDVVEDIRSKTNIADVIDQFVSLSKSGNNLFGLCPFHEENTPSFSVNEQKQIFHCFSCGRGGNVFKFIMEFENVSFPQAVIKVADMQGIKLPAQYTNADNSRSHVNPVESKLIDMHEQTAELYNHFLMNTDYGQHALDYLHKRGLTDDTIKFYKLGFAPSNRILSAFLKNKGFDYQSMRKSGLFLESDDGELRDRFFNRIMYPIKNEVGSIVGFSGRVLDKNESQAKYLNSPETEIFNKRKILFNFSDAKNAIRKEKTVILFEGFMDVISAYQSGVENGIASMGTSLTREQVHTINRITKKLYVCYDGDAPGQNAINRALSLLGNTKLELGVIQMPKGVDPDEYRKQNGEEKFAEYMKSALESPLSFKMRYLKLNRNLDNENDQLTYINDVLKEIAKLPQPLERDIYVNQLAEQFNVSKLDLTNQMNKFSQRDDVRKQSEEPHDSGQTNVSSFNNVKSYSKVEIAERNLFHRILDSNEMWNYLMTKDNFAFVDDNYELLYTLAQGYMKDHDEYNSAEFQDFIKDEKLQHFLINIEMTQISEHSSFEEIDDYVNIIMTEAPLDDQIKQKKADLNEAKKLGDVDRQTKLAMDIIDLQRKKQLSNKA